MAGGKLDDTIAIVGGGIGGLCAAIGFLKQKIPMHIYEGENPSKSFRSYTSEVTHIGQRRLLLLRLVLASPSDLTVSEQWR